MAAKGATVGTQTQPGPPTGGENSRQFATVKATPAPRFPAFGATLRRRSSPMLNGLRAVTRAIASQARSWIPRIASGFASP